MEGKNERKVPLTGERAAGTENVRRRGEDAPTESADPGRRLSAGERQESQKKPAPGMGSAGTGTTGENREDGAAERRNLRVCIVTGLSGIHYLHTGDAALNGLSQVRNGSIFDVLASQRGNSTGKVTFLHGSITDNHHFVQHFTVFRECYHNLFLSFHGNFQRLIAHE